MTFQDFLEHFYSALKKGVPAGPHRGELGVPPELAPLGGYDRLRELVEQAHVFHLEAPEDEASFMKEVGRDALEDLKATLPVPFDNFAIVQEDPATGDWQFRWVLRVGAFGAWPAENNLFRPENQFLLWVYSSASAGTPLGFFSSLRFEYLGGPAIDLRLSPASIDRFAQGLGRTPADAQAALQTIVTGVLLEIGAISHPANYIVERTPALSPREERQAARGEPRPPSKRSHFIMVDHDRLVELNPATRGAAASGGNASTHASPVPHARRGHWRRLAESCSKARAEGKTRIWVGATYVGEREFGDGRNRYCVLHLHPRPDTNEGSLSRTTLPRLASPPR